jgi:hypothetical protein
VGRGLAAALVALLAAAGCSRQHHVSWPPPRVLDRTVTVRTRDHRTMKARATATPSGIVWRTTDGEALPAAHVHVIIQVRHGRGAAQGLGFGALAGVVTGAAVGYADGDSDCSDGETLCFSVSAENKAFLGAILLGAVGCGVGALVGGIIGSRDEYEIVSPSPVPRVTASPVPGGASARLIWSF